jgi:hypothetical protein
VATGRITVFRHGQSIGEPAESPFTTLLGRY